MTKSTIQLPKEISEIVNERGRVWEDYDNIMKRVEELNGLSQKVDGSGTLENITTLTNHNTPPSEIIQIIAELQKEFKNINNAQSHISMNESEIQKIKQRMMMIYIGAGVTIVIILFLVVSAVSR